MSLGRIAPLFVVVALVAVSCGGSQQPAQSASAAAPSASSSAAPPDDGGPAPSDDASTAQSTPEERCRDAARACAVSMISGDYPATIRCMADEAIAYFGRANVEAALATAKAKIAEYGVTVESDDIDLPDHTTPGGGRLFAIVPQQMTLKVARGGRARTKSYLLGVSSDDGRTWKFVDGAGITREKAASIFPSFPADLVLPTIQPPERLQ